ncbi:VOC family protein [Streptomyces nymphaeiformis]|uniref:VOC family protein n=1 Tax=Streptomyces nymphaeiformis TaxID=2663842 RepID=UPI0035E409FC
MDEVTDDHATVRSAKGVGPGVLRTPGSRSGWNRVHLDVRPCPGGDMTAEEVRLRSLGAAFRRRCTPTETGGTARTACRSRRSAGTGRRRVST